MVEKHKTAERGTKKQNKWGKKRKGMSEKKAMQESRRRMVEKKRSRKEQRQGWTEGETKTGEERRKKDRLEMEKLVRFYSGQDLIWSQVGSSQRQSSSVNHHPSGCWHSERPGSNLCRSTDLSTDHSISAHPPTKVSVPTSPSWVSRPCQKSFSTSSPGLHPVAFAALSTRLNITRLLLWHSAVTWQNPLSKAIYSSLFTVELSIKHQELVQDCLLCSCWSLCCNHMLSTVRSNSWHLLSTELRAKVSSFCV